MAVRASQVLHSPGDGFELFTREGSHGLCAHAALSNGAHDEASRRLVVRSFGNHNIVILSHDKIETNQPSTNFFCRFIEESQPFGGILDFPDPLFCEVHQANIGWHLFFLPLSSGSSSCMIRKTGDRFEQYDSDALSV